MYWLKLFFIYYHNTLFSNKNTSELNSLLFKSTFLNLESLFLFSFMILEPKVVDK
jgi:hypothetical protein